MPTMTTTSYDPTKQPQYKPTDYNQVKQPTYQNYTATNYTGVSQPSFTTTAKPGNTVNYGDVKNQINQAKNTQNQAQYQTPEWFSQAAQSNYQAMDPLRRQQAAGINQQYNQSARRLSEMLEAKGLGRSGNAVNQTIGLEQGRNAALARGDANILAQAIAQTLPQAQLGLSERGFLYGQQQDAVNNLASLLGQQTAHQQFADQFNNQWAQQGYANTIDQLARQAAENQYSNQYNNSLSQQAYENALNQLGLQNQENQWAAQFGQGQYQTGLDEAFRQAQLAQQGQQFNAQQALVQRELDLRQQGMSADQALAQRELDLRQQGMSADQAYQQAQLELQRGQLTGNIGGQQTLPAQQLAAQLAQQQADNIYRERLEQQQMLQSLLQYQLGIGQVTDDFPMNNNFLWGDYMQNLYNTLYGGGS